MIKFFRTLVIACHVSAWNLVTRKKGVTSLGVIIAGMLSRSFVGYYYFSVTMSGISAPMKYLAICAGVMNLLACGGYMMIAQQNLSDSIVKMLKNILRADMHLESAYKIQTLRSLSCLLSWAMLLTVLFSATTLSNRVLLNLIFGFLIMHTVTAFFAVGLALVDKGPPKKKEENPEVGDRVPEPSL